MNKHKRNKDAEKQNLKLEKYHGSVGCRSTHLTLSDLWANFFWSRKKKKNQIELYQTQANDLKEIQIVKKTIVPWSRVWEAVPTKKDRETSKQSVLTHIREFKTHKLYQNPKTQLKQFQILFGHHPYFKERQTKLDLKYQILNKSKRNKRSEITRSLTHNNRGKYTGNRDRQIHSRSEERKDLHYSPCLQIRRKEAVPFGSRIIAEICKSEIDGRTTSI